MGIAADYLDLVKVLGFLNLWLERFLFNQVQHPVLAIVFQPAYALNMHNHQPLNFLSAFQRVTMLIYAPYCWISKLELWNNRIARQHGIQGMNNQTVAF